MNRYKFITHTSIQDYPSKKPQIETSVEKILEYNKTEYWYKEELLSIHLQDYQIIEPPYVKISNEEYYNNGGSSDFEKKTIPYVCINTSKLHKGESAPRIVRRLFYPRYEATAEDLQKLEGLHIKDAVLRCGRNQKTGKYSDIWKYVSLILTDGTEYMLHGEILPWHRFGDSYLDYRFKDYQNNVIEVFSEMKVLPNGKYQPVYDYHYQSDNYLSSSEVDDLIDDMREDGAQFSFDD